MENIPYKASLLHFMDPELYSRQQSSQKAKKNIHVHIATDPYMKIGDVAKLFDLNTSVLRFWEDKFEQLSPTRTKSGQRLYSEQDIAYVKELKKLLHIDKLTIEGAKKKLDKSSASVKALPKKFTKQNSQKVKALSLNDEIAFETKKKPSAFAALKPEVLRLLKDELLELKSLLAC